MNLDPHKNIFYYYRGPSSKQIPEEEKILYDTQVEDNTTKALINCFENCHDKLLNFFIQYFGINLNYKDKPQFLLQVSKSKSRPDAEIKTPKKSIFIESKIASAVNVEQLGNHLKGIGEKNYLILITKDVD